MKIQITEEPREGRGEQPDVVRDIVAMIGSISRSHRRVEDGVTLYLGYNEMSAARQYRDAHGCTPLSLTGDDQWRFGGYPVIEVCENNYMRLA